MLVVLVQILTLLGQPQQRLELADSMLAVVAVAMVAVAVPEVQVVAVLVVMALLSREL